MKKRYYAGAAFLLVPVAWVAVIATGVISPVHLGVFLIRGGFASLMAAWFGVALIRRGYQISKETKWQRNLSQN